MVEKCASAPSVPQVMSLVPKAASSATEIGLLSARVRKAE